MTIAAGIAGALALLVAGTVLRSWKRPQLGVINGSLRPCPSSNCVCSQCGGDRFVEPFDASSDPAQAFESFVRLIRERSDARVASIDGSYAHIEFTTPILRFVDDVELLLDPEAEVIHIRSASRVGKSDFGKNRSRVEELRAAWKDLRGALK
jgi:uncharacterized protein (DUF1499 family)